jgi:hypothetical protein
MIVVNHCQLLPYPFCFLSLAVVISPISRYHKYGIFSKGNLI